MVLFSDTDDAEFLNENAPALDFAWMRIGLVSVEIQYMALSVCCTKLNSCELSAKTTVGTLLPDARECEWLGSSRQCSSALCAPVLLFRILFGIASISDKSCGHSSCSSHFFDASGLAHEHAVPVSTVRVREFRVPVQ